MNHSTTVRIVHSMYGTNSPRYEQFRHRSPWTRSMLGSEQRRPQANYWCNYFQTNLTFMTTNHQRYTRTDRQTTYDGDSALGNAEFAGVDNTGVDISVPSCKGGLCRSGQISMMWQGWTLQEWTMRHHVAGADNAGVDLWHGVVRGTMREWTMQESSSK